MADAQERERLLGTCGECGRAQTVALVADRVLAWGSAGGTCHCGSEEFEILTAHSP